jgi:hypothetical protein
LESESEQEPVRVVEICQHNTAKYACMDCFMLVCRHNLPRADCRICGKCVHGVRRDECFNC